MEQITLYTVTPEELAKLIATALQKGIAPAPVEQEPETLMTPRETAAFLKVSQPTLRDWTRREFVKGARVGGCVRYRKSDLLNSMKAIAKR